MTLKELLEKALARIKEFGWTQHAYARRADGLSVDAGSPEAKCYCAYGAFLGIYEPGSRDRWALCRLKEDAFGILSARVPHGNLVNWNDAPDRKKEDVIELFEAAIKEAS